MKFKLTQNNRKIFSCTQGGRKVFGCIKTTIIIEGNPSSLTATVISPYSVSLSWTIGSTGYYQHYIERSQNGVDYAQVGAANYGASTYIDTSLNSGTIYFYRVRASWRNVYSDYSNIAIAETYYMPDDIANLFAWYDVSQLTGLNDSDNIAQITDFSGNSRHLLPYSSRYATYQTNELNNLPSALFNGTSSEYLRDISSSPLTQPSTYILVARMKDVNFGCIFGSGELFFQLQDDRLQLNADTALGVIDLTSLLDRAFIGSLIFNGANSYYFENSDEKSSGNAGTSNTNALCLGAYLVTHSMWKYMDFFELIIYNAGLNTNNRVRIEKYLSWKYNLTLILPAPEVFVHLSPSVVYVSPDGTGDGSTGLTPIEFSLALISDRIVAGDEIILLDGVYTGNYLALISGTALNRINIHAQNCYQAIIDGGIIIGDNTGVNGCNLTFQNLHVYYSDTNRGTGVEPAGTFIRPNSFTVQGTNCYIINNIIHDGGLGITAYEYADGLVAYGNINYNYGAYEVGGAGQCLYIHSTNKTVKHNIIGGSFRKSVAVYTTNGTIEDITLEENIIFSSDTVLFGGDASDGQVISGNILNNHIIPRGIQVGYTMQNNLSVTCQNNRVYARTAAAIYFSYFKTANISNNIFTGGSAAGGGYQGQLFDINNHPDYPAVTWIINNNEYHHRGVPAAFVNSEGVDSYTMAEWQAMGYDAASTYDEILPITNETFVYPNEYSDACRMGIVVIWNWEGLSDITTDLTSLDLQIGTTYRWRQAQDPLVDVDTWVCADNSYTFPMTGHTVAKPTGVDIELIETQFPTFGCFIIEKT